MKHATLPPKLVFETVEGHGLTHITIKVDKRDSADAGLAFLRRLLPVAREADQVSRSRPPRNESAANGR